MGYLCMVYIYIVLEIPPIKRKVYVSVDANTEQYPEKKINTF